MRFFPNGGSTKARHSFDSCLIIVFSQLCIHWSDGHLSEYTSSWLRDRTFDDGAKVERQELMARGPAKVLWDATDYQGHLNPHDFAAITTNNNHLYRWLSGKNGRV